jgi:hypothetical protein
MTWTDTSLIFHKIQDEDVLEEDVKVHQNMQSGKGET